MHINTLLFKERPQQPCVALLLKPYRLGKYDG